MAWDIHSYFEVRDGPGSPWRLVQRPRLDEDGRWDVAHEEQPFRGMRSTSFFAVLTGIIAARAGVDYGRLVSLVPEDRPLAEDLSAELARVYEPWSELGVAGPFWLTLTDLEETDWDRPIHLETSEHEGRAHVPLGELAGAAEGLIPEMRALAEGRGREDVRLIFWLDS